MHARLAGLPGRPVPVWVNIGKNKATPNGAAVEDYRRCVQALGDVADAFVVSRITEDAGRALGTLPPGLDLDAIIERVRPTTP